MSLTRLPLSADPDTAAAAPAQSKLQLSDDRALALATVGFRAVPQPYRPTKISGSAGAGAQRLTWFIDAGPAGGVAAAAAMVEAHRQGRLATDAPYAAALAGITTLRALLAWADGEPVIVQTRGRLRALEVCRKAQTEIGLPAEVFQGGHGVWFSPGRVSDADAARADEQAAAICAAIVCGIPVWPVLQASGGRPAVRLAAHSLTFPGLTFRDLAAAMARPGSTLPGYAPEEHPAFYAAGAVRNVRGFVAAQKAAEKNPVLQIRSRNGRGAAFVSQSLLEGPGTGEFKDQVRAHLLKP